VSVNAECKIAFGLVGVGGYRTPIHLVDSRGQGFYAHSHHVAVHLRLTLADFDAVRVRHSEVRECALRYSRLRLPTVTFTEVEAAWRSREFSMETALPPVRTVTDSSRGVTGPDGCSSPAPFKAANDTKLILGVAHHLSDIDVSRFAHQTDAAVTAPHCVEIALLTEIVDDLHQVRLRDPETLRDVLDRRQLTVVKPDLNKDAQREIGMKG